MADSTVQKSAAGRRKPPGGSRKGIPNKLTQEFRVTIQKLLDENRENVAEWLQQVATGIKDKRRISNPDPARALDLLAKLAEYAAPKLARHEHTGEGGGAIKFEAVERRVIDPVKPL